MLILILFGFRLVLPLGSWTQMIAAVKNTVGGYRNQKARGKVCNGSICVNVCYLLSVLPGPTFQTDSEW